MSKHFALKGNGQMAGIHFVETGQDEMYVIGMMGWTVYVDRRMPKTEARNLWSHYSKEEGFVKVDPLSDAMPSVGQYDSWIRNW